MHNQTIIQLLREGRNQEALKCLYEVFPSVKHFVKMHGGNDDDASDVFQEALIVFYRNALNPRFQLTCAVGTYLFSIVKYKWKDELKRKNLVVRYEIEFPDVADDIEAAHRQERRFRIADQVIAQLGEKCREILTRYYYKKQTMDDIAAALDYRNTDTVKTQKYKCLERARTMAKETMYSQTTAES